MVKTSASKHIMLIVKVKIIIVFMCYNGTYSNMAYLRVVIHT